MARRSIRSATAKKSELAGGGVIVATVAAAAVIAGRMTIADEHDHAAHN